jgi:hypothetical protein
MEPANIRGWHASMDHGDKLLVIEHHGLMLPKMFQNILNRNVCKETIPSSGFQQRTFRGLNLITGLMNQ